MTPAQMMSLKKGDLIIHAESGKVFLVTKEPPFEERIIQVRLLNDFEQTISWSSILAEYDTFNVDQMRIMKDFIDRNLATISV